MVGWILLAFIVGVVTGVAIASPEDDSYKIGYAKGKEEAEQTLKQMGE